CQAEEDERQWVEQHHLKQRAGEKAGNQAKRASSRNVERVMGSQIDARDGNREREPEVKAPKPALAGERDGDRRCGRGVSGGEGKCVGILHQSGKAPDARAWTRSSADALEALRENGGDEGRRAQQKAALPGSPTRRQQHEPDDDPGG